MRFVVRVTRKAASNLGEIAEWLAAEGGPEVALRWLDSIERELSDLSAYPARHPLAPEDREVRGPEIRQLISGNYRVLFLVRDAAVFVLHVRHASRRAATLGEVEESLDETKDAPP
jgi:plasmid stabilization system protein ParE